MSMKLSVVIATPEVEPWPYQLLSGSFAEKAAKAADMGYEGVELVCLDLDRVDLPAVKRTLRDHGLDVAGLVTGALYAVERLCLMAPDDSVVPEAMRRFRQFLDFAGEYGAVVDVGLFRGRLDAMSDKDGGLAGLRERLLESAEYAQSRGARVTLEPINRFESDFIHSAQDGLEWVGKVGHPSFGLMLDTFHMNIEDACIERSVRDAAECLWHVHIGDSNRLSAGEGHFDFAGMVGTLKDVGFNGFLSSEHLFRSDPDTAARKTAETLRPML